MDKDTYVYECKRFISALHDKGVGGFMSHIDLEYVDYDPDTKTVTLACETDDWCTNFGGSTHGGIVTAAFDQSMGVLAYLVDGFRAPLTLNLQVVFARPVPVNTRVIIQVTCTNSGKTFCNCTAKMWEDGRPDRILTTCSGAYYTLNGVQLPEDYVYTGK